MGILIEFVFYKSKCFDSFIAISILSISISTISELVLLYVHYLILIGFATLRIVITSLARYSKPGCRRYRSVSDLPKVRGGLGIAVVSTNQGVLSDRECRQRKVGGEVLCTVD